VAGEHLEERIARYEARAVECRCQASEAHTDHMRDQFLRVASEWQQLADDLRKRPFV
jgi:hypothetical protein